MNTKMKFAVDMVLDAFDDAVLNVPAATREERVVALVDELLPLLIERATKCGAVDANDDLTSAQKAAFMMLLRKSIEETPDCVAACLVRVTHGGRVIVSGASTGLKEEFMPELGRRLKNATYGFALDTVNVDACGCPNCVARRSSAIVQFGGPKAEA